MLDKKQIWVIFLFEFKIDHKAAGTTGNINNTFGQGTTNKHEVQWWIKKFCKGDKKRALKMLSTVASHQKLTKTSGEDHRSWFSFNYTRSCQRTQGESFYPHLKQSGKVKKFD